SRPYSFYPRSGRCRSGSAAVATPSALSPATTTLRRSPVPPHGGELTMAQGLRKYVEAIPGRPLPHGILGGCADVRDIDDVHELLGVEWLALGCCPVRDWVDPCLSDESPGEESPGAPAQKE